ncbi:type VI secretion system baseplate subunit TssG [Paracoccus aminophilus]|uniref:Type VI secretion system protein ImpH n=1 Tax=Paracoccus aminophilus JCM 7686 TaxID=1367847 RepID=S5Y7K2_PARAH|nr:type VI secretion system baseplate subunit TssG [Paracoccus aminophilus]AGT11485.1 type VI secretion system protein ImpH [Paracoccus aminophilus JCM 7686]
MIASDAGFLALLRRFERTNPEQPPIGRSRRIAEEAVRLGQDPELAFPTAEFSETEKTRKGVPDLRVQFMGFFGQNGALPLNTTEEAYRWTLDGEEAFVRFTDIFATRFYQLFFRAWSDSHAITQFDHPEGDRFADYVAALSGIGTPAFLDHDRFPDLARLPLVSIFGGRVRSPVRLQQMLIRYFGLEVDVEEHVPSWMEFDPEDFSRLGENGALGRSTYLGAKVRSVGEKIRLHVRARTLAEYRAFLPGAESYGQMANLVFWYLGKGYDVEVALSLPESEIPPARLGQNADLGWMAALPRKPKAKKKKTAAKADEFVEASRFALALDSGLKRAA